MTATPDHEQAERLAYEEIKTALLLLPKTEKWVYCRAAENALDKLDALAAQLAEAQRENERLREAIASAMTSLATGPGIDGYAYAVLAATENPDGTHGPEHVTDEGIALE